MVDRILGKEEESKSEAKPMFVITTEKDTADFEITDDNEESFIQEEYDLQLQIEQMTTSIETADEFQVFSDKIRYILQITNGALANGSPSEKVFKQVIQAAIGQAPER